MLWWWFVVSGMFSSHLPMSFALIPPQWRRVQKQNLLVHLYKIYLAFTSFQNSVWLLKLYDLFSRFVLHRGRATNLHHPLFISVEWISTNVSVFLLHVFLLPKNLLLFYLLLWKHAGIPRIFFSGSLMSWYVLLMFILLSWKDCTAPNMGNLYSIHFLALSRK